MTRPQALIISVLTGFVVLACIGVVVIIMLPYEQLFPAAPVPTAPLPTLSPAPTFPSFLPTASLETPIPAEPTATNTRLPTSTPRPPRTPTPTVFIKLTLPVRPTSTPQIVTVVPVPTLTPSATLTPLPGPRGYSVSFEAEETKIVKGECTNLRWKVEGASSVDLAGESVAAAGKEKICPKYDTGYKLTVRLPDNTQFHRTVKISVEKEDN